MQGRAAVFLIIAAVIFAAYVLNVVLGALANAAVLTDVGEMITLFAAPIAFTVAILKRETAEQRARSQEENNLKGGIE